MSYRIAQKSFKGDMLRLATPEQSDKQGKWFFLEPEVQKFSKGFNVGDQVEVKTEERGKDNFITFLKKEGDNSSPQTSTGTSTGYKKSYSKSTYSSSEKKPFVPYGAKSPQESEKISRLSVMSTTAVIVAAVIEKEGTLPVKELIEVTTEIYDALLAKIKEGLDLPVSQQSEETVPF